MSENDHLSNFSFIKRYYKFSLCSFVFVFCVFFIVLCSLLFTNCENPLVELALKPRTIVFNTNGGNLIDNQILYRGERAVRPANPEKIGHDFDGWYEDNIIFENEWDFSVEPEGDLTLFAKWRRLGIDLSSSGDKDFGSLVMGYSQDDLNDLVYTVTVFNIALQPTGELSISLSNGEESNFILSTNTIPSIDVAETNYFTVVPKTGLLAGTYRETVTVTGDNNIHASFNVTFTVGVQSIISANVNLFVPSTGGVPNTTASVNPDHNYTVGTITWSPNHNPFLGNQQYTATVTLSAKENYTFLQSGFTASINNEYNASVTLNTGATVTISYQFPPLDVRIVTDIIITNQPLNLNYIHGEILNLDGLLVTLMFDDGTIDEDIPPEGFGLRGISTSIANRTKLSFSGTYNNQRVSISSGGESVETSDNLVITKREVTITGVTVSDKVYDGTTAAVLSAIPLLENNDDGANLFVKQGSANFDNKNAGDNKTVTFTGWTLDGPAAANYILSGQPASVIANITPRQIFVIGAEHTRSFIAGDTSATGVTLTLSGILPEDAGSVFVDTFTAEYTSAAAGTQTMNINGLTLTGTEAGNYSITQSAENVPVIGGGITGAAPVVSWPEGLTAIFGQMLSDVTLPGNGTGTAGTFTWTAGGAESVGNAGIRTHNVTFTPSDLSNYAVQNKNVEIDVARQPITFAGITVNNPVTGQERNTIASSSGTAQITGDGSFFSTSAVTWTPDHIPFQGGVEYTASLTLNVNNNYIFPESGFTAEINGQPVSIPNSGTSVILSRTFQPTDTRSIFGVEVITQPVLIYTHHDTLNLSNLAARITYNDGSTADVSFNDPRFNELNFITTPANGTRLIRSTHDGTKVKVSVSGKVDETDALTVNQATPTITFPVAATITYGINLSTSALTGGSAVYGSETLGGSFAWADSAVIPFVNNSGYEVTFTPASADKVNYDWSSVSGWDNLTETIKRIVSISVNPRALTITSAAHTKPYDTTTTASDVTVTLDNIVGTDVVTAIDVSGVYTSANAGTQTINITALNLAGADSNNYSLILPVNNVHVTGGGITRINPPTVNWPTGLTAIFGQTLSDITFPGNISGTDGVFSWTAGETVSVGNQGTNTHSITFTPTDTNFNTLTQDVSLTVSPQPITIAAINVTAPDTGATPNPIAGGSGNFSVSAVTWSPGDTTFLGGVAYTAQVTLTASTNYTFPANFTATIEGTAASISDNIGTSVTLSRTFPATNTKFVTSMTITQPTTLSYTHGGTLNLNGLFVTLTYNDGTTATVQPAQFAANNITTTLSDGSALPTTLTRSLHNNLSVTVIYNSSPTIRANTNPITIERAAGASVGAPTLNGTPTATSLSVNTISTPATGQSIEYVISTSTTAPATGWQNSTTFNMPFDSTTYYVHARTVENDNFFAGTPVSSAAITFHRVTFNSDGGNFTPPSQIVFNGQFAVAPPTNPVKTGYGFHGWRNAGTTWDFASNTVNADVTLTANWVANQIFSISFAQITDLAPDVVVSTGLTFSQTGASGQQTGLTISLPDPSAGQTFSNISWNHAGHTLGTGTSLTLSNSDIRVNAVGDDKIISLLVFINGVPYSRNITFNVVP